jgi:pimeloyl-ACP methyl ester carboxylesterase
VGKNRDSSNFAIATAPQASGSTRNWNCPHFFRIRVRDGLQLYVRHWPAPGSPYRPVLCLPGLTRNHRDFAALAEALSDPAGLMPRPVYALDARGRGLSQRSEDWKTYTVQVETHDTIDVMAALGLHGAAIVGTSRGGLVTMLLAAIQPTALGPVVLNDIGPVIEREGLLRIAGYVGRVPLPATWEEAGKLVRDIDARAFPGRSDSDWERIARQRFAEKDGRPAPGYDPNLSRAFSVLDGPIPALWPQFEALAGVPVMVIRGALSDLLSAATVAEMAKRHPRLAALAVADEGHAPLLQDQTTIAAVARFLDKAERPH